MTARDDGRIHGCTGVLLAGGRGRRLGGIAKGLLRREGRPLVEWSLSLFAELFDGAILVADDPSPYAWLGARAVPDLVPRRGAPGGLLSGLAAASTDWIFLAACDMPFLSREGIALLAGLRGEGGAVVARWGGRLEPLHALWSRRALPEVERQVRAGTPSLQELAAAVGAREVEEAAWREVDPQGLAFASANAPADLERLGIALPAPASLRPPPHRV